MFTASAALSSNALAAFTVPENKTTFALPFRHPDYGTDIFVRDQAAVTSLKREKAYFLFLQQTISLLKYFSGKPGFQGNSIVYRQGG